MLEPVRESFRTGQPIEWTRVHDLPDFAYFNHSIHVNKGVGCVTCHGGSTRCRSCGSRPRSTMEWCLECHRQPERYVRPRDHVFDMDWEPPANDPTWARGSSRNTDRERRASTNCSTCHR